MSAFEGMRSLSIVLGLVDDDVLGSWLEAVLDAAVAGDGLLVGSCVEESDVQGLRVVRVDLREEDGVGVLLGVVVVLAVAGEASEEDSLVRLVPLVDRQEDEFLLDAPDIGEGGHEGAVYHVPFLAVILLLDSEDGEYGGSALADGIGTELGEDVGFLDSPGVADALDLGHYLLDHVFVVVVHAEGILDRQSAADIQGIEGRADGLEVAVDVDTLAQLVPVVGVVLDAGVDEEVQHLEAEFLVLAELFLVEWHDVLVADAQTGGVELELWLLLGGDTDADAGRHIDSRIELVELGHVVQDGGMLSRMGMVLCQPSLMNWAMLAM